MKTQNTQFPPAEEWDFRGVADAELEQATIYEYARSSDKIRNAICDCLKSKINGRTVAEYIRDLIAGKNEANRPPKGTWAQIFNSLLKATAGNRELMNIILHFQPDFPAPWKQMPDNQVAKGNLFFQPINALKNCAGIETVDGFYLSISWRGATIEGCVKQFETWLREEIKKHPQRKQAGKNAQVLQAAYPLKCLAALRLRRRGITYPAAVSKLQTVAITKRDAWFIPMFENAPSWTKAIRFAERSIARIESGQT
jgi:hypothetical protein